MTGVFDPPKALGGRITWFFLLFGLFNLVVALLRALGHTGCPFGPRVAAAVTAVALGGWWLHRYRKQTFPAWTLPLEGLAVGIIAVGLHHWVAILSLTFVSVSFRGLYGTWKHVLAVTAIVLAASVAGVALTQPDDVVDPGPRPRW